MRAGTQTLIQALQALPWTSSNSSDNEDDGHDTGTGESDSEDEKPRRKQDFRIHEASPTFSTFSKTFGFLYTHYSPSSRANAERADS
jgi:hypothetical protein